MDHREHKNKNLTDASSPVVYEDVEESVIKDATVYHIVSGSRAYGTHRPDSDRDEKGVCVLSDPRYYVGFQKFAQKDKWEDGNDRVIFDIRKFTELALKCNPNIIEMLYVVDEDVLHCDEVGAELRANRELFVTKEAARTFLGYAFNQLGRMQGHFAWLENPPDKPVEEDYNKVINLDMRSAPYQIQLESHRFTVKPKGYVVVEHYDGAAFKAANKKFNQYLKWVRDRNPDRAAIEAEHGYDCKHAMHLIRLLKMGKEILTTGEVIVRRPDAAELVEIRNGKYTYEELLDYAEQLKAELRNAEETSDLPPSPDSAAAERLLMRLVKSRIQL